jgi:hypothetical protein
MPFNTHLLTTHVPGSMLHAENLELMTHRPWLLGTSGLLEQVFMTEPMFLIVGPCS